LDGKIAFLDIPELIEKSMEAHQPHPVETIEMVMEADRWARKTALGLLKN
jgi:1-deoxy-D-xylulose-5-phosphate reductoisomerase